MIKNNDLIIIITALKYCRKYKKESLQDIAINCDISLDSLVKLENLEKIDFYCLFKYILYYSEELKNV